MTTTVEPGPNPVDVHVGRQVTLRRLELGLSQSELGEALGVSFQQVQKYEKGANRISASRLWSVASFLGVEIGYFFPTEGGHPPGGAEDVAGIGETFARAARRLTPARQKLVLEYMRIILETPDQTGSD